MEQENKKELNQIAESLKEIASSMNKDPQAERYHSETHCPSCGRFVGTETRCPYCQTETQKRLSIRIFKVISVLISTLGLLMLLFYARNVKTPEAKITELGPLTNFAHVRIVGFADKAVTRSKWGTLSLTVNQYYDKNGELVFDTNRLKDCEKHQIRVTAYKKVADNIDDSLLPKQGDLVDVEGQVRVQQGEASLLINAPEHFRTESDVEKSASNTNNEKCIFNTMDFQIVTPEVIDVEMVGSRVMVFGTVKSVQPVENDCVVIRLENGKVNGIPVFVPAFSKKKIAMPQVGDKIEVRGMVKKYQNEIEVSVEKGTDYIRPVANNK